ncbi:MAG: phosphotransferase [Gemmatimonadetes bacterium]|nr:phosphotransferase [Gemmatimonadota bacterium]MYH19946.1 phosphotransferase [Gemmatimonadota bacterium]MYK98827.1 phosphotransferase [Gemmatimonadota bacterium]
MNRDAQDRLVRLFHHTFGRAPVRIASLGADGSSRKYFRLVDGGRTVIGTANDDRRENVAFLSLSRHFRRHGLPVPEIFAEDLEQGVYLQQDLGDETLFSQVAAARAQEGTFSDRLVAMYRQVLDDLPRFQVTAAADLDFSVCYPRSRFDAQSIRWDLNYFKYHFLKLVPVDFDEQALENDFERLTAFLLEADTRYFLYRDFQSRNIMWHEGRPHYIDYQGGRQGALQYDVASLLQDAKADIPWEIRDEFLDYYVAAAGAYAPLRRDAFLAHYYGYALVRLMQALGAYGYRGLYEGKSHFLTSISHGVRNLEGLLERAGMPVDLPELNRAWSRIVDDPALRRMGEVSGEGLTVHLWSFSYHNGLPRDPSGNGGGFVFDCRIVKNPGRIPKYADLTGKDAPVAAFLDELEEARSFLGDAQTMVDRAVDHHLRREFTDLTVAFGCTGGQHRSVYFAERLAAHLKERPGLTIRLRHREQEDS